MSNSTAIRAFKFTEQNCSDKGNPEASVRQLGGDEVEVRTLSELIAMLEREQFVFRIGNQVCKLCIDQSKLEALKDLEKENGVFLGKEQVEQSSILNNQALSPVSINPIDADADDSDDV